MEEGNALAATGVLRCFTSDVDELEQLQDAAAAEAEVEEVDVPVGPDVAEQAGQVSMDELDALFA